MYGTTLARLVGGEPGLKLMEKMYSSLEDGYSALHVQDGAMALMEYPQCKEPQPRSHRNLAISRVKAKAMVEFTRATWYPGLLPPILDMSRKQYTFSVLDSEWSKDLQSLQLGGFSLELLEKELMTYHGRIPPKEWEDWKPGTLALWMMGSPRTYLAVKKRLGQKKRRLLSYKDYQELVSTYPDDVVYVCQAHGDLVTVPPGWWHQVINVQPCAKVAWDKWDPKDMFSYVQCIQLLTSAGCLEWLAHDYQSLEPVLVEGAAEMARMWGDSMRSVIGAKGRKELASKKRKKSSKKQST
ncbi:hypothetical protein GPECTOR_836g70 [Gonium pectorale]|uniref:JmjC domain-containing protein n=1 Tax=Gonium pectorale TaxID=33097 RepID=A0A150FVM5_GONPE|nr:hypothetical protein GPECTOR_836g70 [Gonium pectorale]|eukprot:KXZ41080.1 hypothetical protein GPECTOR_836g70 [Gonium pectorale]